MVRWGVVAILIGGAATTQAPNVTMGMYGLTLTTVAGFLTMLFSRWMDNKTAEKKHAWDVDERARDTLLAQTKLADHTGEVRAQLEEVKQMIMGAIHAHSTECALRRHEELIGIADAASRTDLSKRKG